MRVDLCQTGKNLSDEAGQLVCDLSEAGRVVSISEKAVNILISRGLLVSLVARTEQMTAMSVKCPDIFSRLRSRQLKLRVGDTVQIGRGRLTIGGLQIDLKTANRFQGIADRDLAARLEPAKISTLRQVLCTVGRKGGMLGLIDERQADNPFVQKGLQVRDRIFDSHRSQMAGNLAEFVGLGAGFTPSGDDLICGFLLGEEVGAISCNGNPEQWKMKPRPLDETEKKIIWRAVAGTNDGGRTLIWMALQGRFPGFLLDAMAGLSGTEGSAGIFRVVNAAVSRGHTSGTDALVGVLLYLHFAVLFMQRWGKHCGRH